MVRRDGLRPERRVFRPHGSRRAVSSHVANRNPTAGVEQVSYLPERPIYGLHWLAVVVDGQVENLPHESFDRTYLRAAMTTSTSLGSVTGRAARVAVGEGVRLARQPSLLAIGRAASAGSSGC